MTVSAQGSDGQTARMTFVVTVTRPTDEAPKIKKTSAKQRFLSEMQEFDVRMGPWGFGKGSKKATEKLPIVVQGVTSVHGLGMHPPSNGYSSVKYELDGA